MSLFEQWQRGMRAFSYALEAQLHGVKTMAFYEAENREQRTQAIKLMERKWELEDEVRRLKKDINVLEKTVDNKNKTIAILEGRVR